MRHNTRDSKGRYTTKVVVKTNAPKRDSKGRFVKATQAGVSGRRWANQYGYGIK